MKTILVFHLVVAKAGNSSQKDSEKRGLGWTDDGVEGFIGL